MIRRHGELYREMNRLYALGDEDYPDGDDCQASSGPRQRQNERILRL
jgi:hypothetical protein